MPRLPLDGIHRIIEVFSYGGHGHERHGVADGGERVPQLVGEHGKELIFALISLLESHRRPLLVVDVDHDAGKAHGTTIGISFNLAASDNPTDRAVTLDDTIFRRVVGTRFDGLSDAGGDSFAVVGMNRPDVAFKRSSCGLLGRNGEEAGQVGIRNDAVVDDVPCPCGDGSGF